MSNDDQQKTQAIPNLEDLLRSDHRSETGPDEEDAAPTEAIDFSALVASGAFPDLDGDAPPAAAAPPANPFGASGSMGGDLPPTSPPSGSMGGGMDDGFSMGGGMDKGPSMGGGGMGSQPPSMGGGGGGGFSSPPPSSPPADEGGNKTLYIALGVAAFFLFCCCPTLGGGGYFFYAANEVSSDLGSYGDSEEPVAVDENTKNDEEAGGEDSGGGGESFQHLTVDNVQGKVEDLGWKVIGEPTKVNDKSITLPIVKGAVGGAVSINEFDLALATDTFVETMQKSDGAIVKRDGNRALSVVMPGNEPEAKKLMGQLLK